MITQERLHELFDYREDGNLLWKVIKCRWMKMGHVAGTLDHITNCRHIKIDGKRYRLHRIIFLYHYGYLTDGLEIDHIDGNKTNNRIENLREVTSSQNIMNTKLSVRSTSGIKGVFYDKRSKKWQSRIFKNGGYIHRRSHSTIEEAAAAVEEARVKYHGEYARHK
jgi:hypothetical protein